MIGHVSHWTFNHALISGTKRRTRRIRKKEEVQGWEEEQESKEEQEERQLLDIKSFKVANVSTVVSRE